VYVLCRGTLTVRPGITVSPEEIVGLFVQRGMFDEAQSAAASLRVDMTGLFQALASRCVQLSRLSDMSK
jgi:nuclear pore complex protein Nup160